MDNVLPIWFTIPRLSWCKGRPTMPPLNNNERIGNALPWEVVKFGEEMPTGKIGRRPLRSSLQVADDASIMGVITHSRPHPLSQHLANTRKCVIDESNERWHSASLRHRSAQRPPMRRGHSEGDCSAIEYAATRSRRDASETVKYKTCLKKNTERNDINNYLIVDLQNYRKRKI